MTWDVVAQMKVAETEVALIELVVVQLVFGLLLGIVQK